MHTHVKFLYLFTVHEQKLQPNRAGCHLILTWNMLHVWVSGFISTFMKSPCNINLALNPDIRKRVLAVRSHLYGLQLINNRAI